MLLSTASHETTSPTDQDSVFASWESRAASMFDSAAGALENAAESVGTGISSAYNWTKGEIKGAADYTTGFFSSTLLKVGFVLVAAVAVYIIVRKEING